MIPHTPFSVPDSVLHATLQTLQAHGDDGYECFCLWLGTVEHDCVQVARLEIPKQISSHVAEGCHVHVSGEELFRVSALAHETQTLVCAQVHAHPQQAYHSAADEAMPLVSLPGALSLVVPYFAAPPIDVADWAAFRLLGDGSWADVDPKWALGRS